MFRVWAPTADAVELVFEGEDRDRAAVALGRSEENPAIFEAIVPDARPGLLYRYRIDGEGPFPDPASRSQPEGVHGPSRVIDPSAFRWTDAGWRGPDPRSTVIYEIHVGTFTPEGTFAAAAGKLPELAALGVTAIELMPLADFPGDRGWGYDGVSLYAPSRAYGSPDDLRRLVDEAHRLGLAVLIDAVYNHLGPDGNYLAAFSPFYFSDTHQTAWGTGLNFDGDHNGPVRDFFTENALHWIHEYHADGLRLDATHAIRDESSEHILQRIARRCHEAGAALGRRVLVIAEDERNLASLIKKTDEGGSGLDAVWADDLHHQIRRALTGESDGYFADFTGTAEDVATTLRQGWFYTGQATVTEAVPRGSDPAGIPPERFVVCIQNHDQIGNRAFGDRLNHTIDPSAYRAASTLLLTAPQTPLLFMGQEWSASSPFRYFTDHDPHLGELVTRGRRHEFRHFTSFADPIIRVRIPDPQSSATFLASKLDWDERDRPPHAGTLRLYRDLLELRKAEPALGPGGTHDAEAVAEGTILLRRAAGEDTGGDNLIILVALKPGAVVAVIEKGLSVVLTTEDEPYALYSRRPSIFSDETGSVIHFPCPAAIVVRHPARPLQRAET
jgi:maltooligosyltrehalose trehalohydrolase